MCKSLSSPKFSAFPLRVYFHPNRGQETGRSSWQKCEWFWLYISVDFKNNLNCDVNKKLLFETFLQPNDVILMNDEFVCDSLFGPENHHKFKQRCLILKWLTGQFLQFTLTLLTSQHPSGSRMFKKVPRRMDEWTCRRFLINSATSPAITSARNSSLRMSAGCRAYCTAEHHGDNWRADERWRFGDGRWQNH